MNTTKIHRELQRVVRRFDGRIQFHMTREPQGHSMNLTGAAIRDMMPHCYEVKLEAELHVLGDASRTHDYRWMQEISYEELWHDRLGTERRILDFIEMVEREATRLEEEFQQRVNRLYDYQRDMIDALPYSRGGTVTGRWSRNANIQSASRLHREEIVRPQGFTVEDLERVRAEMFGVQAGKSARMFSGPLEAISRLPQEVSDGRFTARRFVTGQEVVEEGKQMRNCIGRIYLPKIVRGTHAGYHIDSPYNKSGLTMVIEKSDPEHWQLHQVVGKANTEPKHYAEVKSFVGYLLNQINKENRDARDDDVQRAVQDPRTHDSKVRREVLVRPRFEGVRPGSHLGVYDLTA